MAYCIVYLVSVYERINSFVIEHKMTIFDEFRFQFFCDSTHGSSSAPEFYHRVQTRGSILPERQNCAETQQTWAEYEFDF